MALFVSNDNLNSYSGYHTDLYSPSDYTIYDEGVDINYTTLGYEIVAESQEEWNTLMKQVALNELAVYSSNGCREVLYEAVDFSALFTRIKNFFKKLADKVKAIFHSFMAKLSSILSRDSTFAKKYGQDFINKVQNIRDDFEFKGYTFTIKKFSNRDDINFDSQLATIYTNKAKVGETKIDNSIISLLNSRGSVSDSLLNPSTFVESVGYYGDYYVLNEYKISNVKSEYDKIYILNSIFPNITNYDSLFLNDDDYIKNLYNSNTVLNNEQKTKVNKIFNKLNYSELSKKIKPGVSTYGELYDLAIIFKNILSGGSVNFNNIAKKFDNAGHSSSFEAKVNKNDTKILLDELRKNYFINPNLLGQYNPETQASGSSSGPGNSGSSSSSATQQPQNSDYYTQQEYEQKCDEIKNKLKDQSPKNISNWSNDAENETRKKYRKTFNDFYNGKIHKSEADREFKELEELVGRYNKAYQAAQASGSGPSSSGGAAQQPQNNGNTVKKTDFNIKWKDIMKKMTNSNYRSEFIDKSSEIQIDNFTELDKQEIEKTIADKLYKQLEDLVDEYNKKPKNSNPSGGNSGGNSGGSGSVGGSSGSGSAGGRNIEYDSPAKKADVYKRANISIQDNSEDIHDTIRGAVAKLYTDNSSAADSYNERDFKNELFKLFRNGADKKNSIPASEIKKNASAIVDEVTTYKNTKDMAKESTNTVIKAIDSVINKLDEYIKRSNKNWTEGSDGVLTSNFTNLLTTITNTFFKTSRSDIVLANNIYLTALKDRCIQNKNIMVKVIAGYDSKKMKNTNESYNYGYDNDYIYNNSGNSFLDNIIFK